MKAAQRVTAIIERKDDGFVALCPELDICERGHVDRRGASQFDRGADAVLRNGFTLASRSPLPQRGLRNSARGTGWVNSGFLSGADVGRILEQNGFAAVRWRGSHQIMQKHLETTTITIPVPLHDALRRGTLGSIVRQSELPRSLFETENQVIATESRITGTVVF